MRNNKILITIVVTGLFSCLFAVQSHALLIHFDPSPVSVEPGSSFNVNLLADIGAQEQLLGWDIDLIFDSSLMSFQNAVVGSLWNSPSMPMPDDDVSIAGLAGFGLPPGTGVYGEDVLLATLYFNCLAPGSSLLNIFTDDALEGFQLATFGFAQWTSNATTINQTSAPVPEPSTMLLIGTGLIGFVGLKKKLRK